MQGYNAELSMSWLQNGAEVRREGRAELADPGCVHSKDPLSLIQAKVPWKKKSKMKLMFGFY